MDSGTARSDDILGPNLLSVRDHRNVATPGLCPLRRSIGSVMTCLQ